MSKKKSYDGISGAANTNVGRANRLSSSSGFRSAVRDETARKAAKKEITFRSGKKKAEAFDSAVSFERKRSKTKPVTSGAAYIYR